MSYERKFFVCSKLSTFCFTVRYGTLRIVTYGSTVLYCGRLDRRPQRYCWPLTVCPISSASGSDAESYNAEYCETVFSQLQLELIHSYSWSAVASVRRLQVKDSCHTVHRLPVTSLTRPHRAGPAVGHRPNQDPHLVENTGIRNTEDRGIFHITVHQLCSMHIRTSQERMTLWSLKDSDFVAFHELLQLQHKG